MALAEAHGAVLWLMVWCENAHCLNSRSETRSVFRIPLGDNPLLIVAVVGAQLLQLAVLAVPPLRELLSMDAATAADGIPVALAGVLVLAVMEIYKLARRSNRPAHAAESEVVGTTRRGGRAAARYTRSYLTTRRARGVHAPGCTQ